MLRPADVIDDRFEIDRPAGSGGMGAVYRAWDRSGRAWAAVKVLEGLGTAVQVRFEREAAILAELRHPSIVRYLAHGRLPSGEPYLAMEWLDGVSLAERLAREGLSLQHAVAVGRRVAEALREVHRRQVVHRDLKPSNLMCVGGDPLRVKLLDFGIAVRPAEAGRVTAAGWLIGSLSYVSPEQATGAIDLDARSDVFSLGCVLFECLTGKRAYEGASSTAVLARIVWEDPPRTRDLAPAIPEVLDALVARMMAKDRGLRPADAGVVARELEALEDLCTDQGARPRGINAPLAAMLSATDDEVDDTTRRGPAPEGAARAARALGDEEQRMVWVVAMRGLDGAGDAAAAACAEVARSFEGRFYALADGSGVALFSASGSPIDGATRAARCALALEAALPGAPIALGGGRAVVSGRLPLGKAVESAVVALAKADGSRPRLDDLTASLVAGRFEVGDDDTGSTLGPEVPGGEAQRRLLGRATPFVGRSSELGVLTSAFDEVRGEEVARAVLVVGGPGMGKSRLRHELMRNLKRLQPAPEIWLGRADPMRASSSLAVIADVVRSAFGISGGDDADATRACVSARVERLLPSADAARVTRFLGELVGVPFPDDDVELRAARRDAILMGDQLRRAIADWLAAECAAGPVVIVIEDLHWADPPSVACVEAALRELGERPLLLLALARPEAKLRFGRLLSGRQVTEVNLGGLSRRAATSLVRAVLGDDVAAETVEGLVERAGGNAFYLEELIRSVAEQEDQVPRAVLAMVQARLDAVDPEGRRILRAASVLGRSFRAPAVSALVGAGGRPGEVAGWLEYLAGREFLTAAEGAEPEYVFRHALVREAAYASLTEADRVLGHRLAGEWLAEHERTDAGVVAEHLEIGGALARACAWYRRAAEQALEGNNLAAAIAHVERAKRSGAAGELSGELLRLEAVARLWRGEYPAAEACAAEAITLVKEGTPRWFEAVGDLVQAAGRLGHEDRLVHVAGVLLGFGSEGSQAVTACARTAMQLFFAGKIELAERLIDRIEAAAASVSGDPAGEAWVLRAREIRAAIAVDPVAELGFIQAAAECFERAGDLRHGGVQRANVGYALLQLGAHADAERELRMALASAERLGLAPMESVALHNLGVVLGQRGALDEALRIERRAVDGFTAQGDRRMEAASRIYLAQILSERGEGEAALVEATRACELAQAANVRLHALAARAGAALGLGRRPEALADATEAMRLLEGMGSAAEGDALARLVHAQALRAAGDIAGSAAAICAAEDRLMARARQIHDPVRRDSFLADVPENARTLALSRAWRE